MGRFVPRRVAAPVTRVRRGARLTRAPASVEPPEALLDGDRFALAIEQAKLDAMKELAYGASHEINNPLANIALRAQTLLKRNPDAESRKALEAIHRAAMRAHEMISDLMLFARPPRLTKRHGDLREVARLAVAECDPLAAERGAAIHVRCDETPVVVDGDAGQLVVAVRALVQNALEALGRGGEVAVSCGVDGRHAVVAVADNGPGVAPEARPHVFDPFFSGREAGRGLGFGLAKCWRIVTDHGGDVSVGGQPAGGAVFTIRLPLAIGP